MPTGRAKPGPRPARGSPMPRTAFTAMPEEVIFLMLYGGDGTISRGVRAAIASALKLDRNAAPLMAKAMWMIQRAEQKLQESGQEATQQAIYRYAADNYVYILADWEERPNSDAAR